MDKDYLILSLGPKFLIYDAFVLIETQHNEVESTESPETSVVHGLCFVSRTRNKRERNRLQNSHNKLRKTVKI
jgi:hypothetical protein